MAMVRSGIGDKPKRREDARFLTGRGGYLDDLAFDGLAHAVVLRSPHAHALIGQLDTAAAQSMPGMLAVLTAADVPAPTGCCRCGRPPRPMPRPASASPLCRSLYWPPTGSAMPASRWR